MSIILSTLRTDGLRDDGKCAIFTRPEVCGYLSANGDRPHVANTSQLKYLIKPSSNIVNFDLKEGYESVQREPANPPVGELNNLLRWILENSEDIEASSESDRWLKPEFVCYRGRLRILFCTPFEENEGWIISACKWRGTIYLCAFDTEDKESTDEMLKFSSWGFKFEQYMLSDKPDEKPNTSKPVNKSEGFYCIYESRLGNHKLLYGAEMDGVSSDKVLKEPIDFNGVKFVELKTSRLIEDGNDFTFKKYKLLKWWSQCYLVGIDEVLCGLRTDDGIVKKLKNYKVAEMPKKSKKFWSPNQCLNFCDAFLTEVKSTVQKDYDECVYKFVWQPGQKVRVEKIDKGSKYVILKDWFIDKA